MTIIGITADSDIYNIKYSLSNAYVKGVLIANGIPVLIPNLTKEKDIKYLLNYLNGVILSGGGDPDPIYFGEEPAIDSGEINPIRDKFEIMLAQKCLLKKIPLLGICRGSQVLNIAAGGSIHQNINNLWGIKHQQQAPRWHPTHYVKLIDNSKLRKIMGTDRIRVNSFHHQAINKVADAKFSISAIARDNIIEAIESNNTFAMGVQWHPEELLESHGKNLFISLVEAAKKDD